MDDTTANILSSQEDGRSSVDGRSTTSLTDLWGEVDRLFCEFASGQTMKPFRRRGNGVMETRAGALAGWGASVAALHIVDREKELLIQAELPGLAKDDLEVQRSDDILTIRGEKAEECESGGEDGPYYVSERRHSTFKRSIRIPDGIDRNEIHASFRKGVLTIRLPKIAEARTEGQKIEIMGEK